MGAAQGSQTEYLRGHRDADFTWRSRLRADWEPVESIDAGIGIVGGREVSHIHQKWKDSEAHAEAMKRIEVEELTVQEILITTHSGPGSGAHVDTEKEKGWTSAP